MENTKKTYDSINVMRMICAILVITIHTSALFSLGDTPGIILSWGIARIAVPFFFITAGYFFYDKFNEKGYTRKYLKRILVYYLGFSAAYTLFVFSYIKQRNSTIGVTIQNILFNGVSGSLWYLPAFMLSIGVVFIFLKKNWIRALVVLSVVVYSIGLIGDSYYGLIAGTSVDQIVKAYDSVFVNTRNGICFGVPFITLGILINKYKLNYKVKKAGVFIAIFSVALGIEAYLLIINKIPSDHNMYISLVLLVPAIFIGLLNSKRIISERRSKLFRDMSLWIYCVHELFMMMLFSYFPSVTSNTLVLFIIVAGLSITTAYIAVSRKAPQELKLKKKERVIITAILACTIIFFIAGTGKVGATQASAKINPNYDLKINPSDKSSNIIGPMWKVSRGDSKIYLYGSIGYGTKDMYPLSPKVEDAIKESEGVVLEVDYDKYNSSLATNVLLLKQGDSFEKHISSEALKIYKDKINEVQSGVYDKINKLSKPGYLSPNYIQAFTTIVGQNKFLYTPGLYFYDDAKINNKTIVQIGDAYKNLEDSIDCSDEVADASVKMLKYINNESLDKVSTALEAWKTGNIEEANSKLDDIYIVPSEERESFNKLNNVVNKFQETVNYKVKKEYTEKIDEYIKDNKKYFVVVTANYLNGDDGILKSLQSKGYTIEQVK